MQNRVSLLMEKIKQGDLDHVFRELYMDESQIMRQRDRYLHALEEFRARYGEKCVQIYTAPGRSEIGGNHTDHQNGCVLAASINLDAIAVVAKSEESTILLESEGYEPSCIQLEDLEVVQKEKGTTNALIRGVANGMVKRGYKIGGFLAYVTSSVLSGSGLSSSASFEVLIGTIFSGLYNEENISPVEIAQIGQEAENQYFGKPCGLMDQVACAVGGLIYINFADQLNPLIKKVDVDFQKFHYSLCIVDTKGSHAELTDEYAAIPAEMKAVAGYFGKELLCGVEEEAFYKQIPSIRSITGDRAVLRAIHWFEENKRVEKEVQALESGDFETFKTIIKASGDSSFKYLQNIYSNKKSVEQNISLALAISDRVLDGKGVSRVHGGGFAGTIQAFVPDEMVNAYKKEMEQIFGAGSCHVLRIRQNGGRKII